MDKITMTVKDLVQILQQMPQDAVVLDAQLYPLRTVQEFSDPTQVKNAVLIY